MTDADDVIEIFSSDSAEEDQDGSEAEMSEGSDDYYNSSEEGSDLGGLGDEGRPTSTTEKRLPYRIIDPDLLKQVQGEAVAEVAGIWNCKRSIAKTLLMHYMWDKEKLLSDFAERGAEYVYKAAGIAQPSDSDAGLGPLDPTAPISCEVCMCEAPGAECGRNGCGHTFCNTCWSSHLAVQIKEGKARHISCMAYKCGVVCDEELVLAVIQGDPALLNKYKQSHLESYMEDNQRVAFCPSTPWCGRAIEVDSDPYVEPECSCGVTFCFRCRKEPHSPCTCKMWDLWEEKVTGDSETRNWMAINTKPCPKCTKPVEKNGGCNLVVCTCGQAFCWLCGGATGRAHTWTSIADHSCGRFKDEAEEKASTAQKSHERYMHYFKHYEQHLDSLKKEKLEKSKALVRIQTKEEAGSSATTSSSSFLTANDYSWMIKAMDQLSVARQVLSNSYAFAYFFFGGDLFKGEFTAEQNLTNKNLFEDIQEQLGQEVERLSGLLLKSQRLLEARSLKLNTAKAEEAAAKEEAESSELRLNTINSSVNIHQRIIRFFEMVESDLYGKLQGSNAQIAVSYRA